MAHFQSLSVGNVTYTPASAACFAFPGNLTDNLLSPCPTTPDMVDFLNLTLKFKHYFEAYCLHTPVGDGCPYGYCPNGDIAGMFNS